MKTSKGNVRCRFGRLLSGILSAAMLFSAAAFQIPVSADDEVGGYEVLYDFVKDGYLEDSKLSDNGTDTITAADHWDNLSLASKTFSAPITGKTVRFHFEIMHEYTGGCPKFYTAVVTDDKGFNLVAGSRWLGIGEHGENAGGPYKIGYYGGRENWKITETTHPTFEKNRWYNIDTIYNLTEGKSYYYIDGVKIGEGDGPTQIMQAGLEILNRGMDLGTSYYKNMMIDSGNAAQITDTNDNGATLIFTNPTELNSSDITVKCLETGETPTVTTAKVNDMKYNLSYSTGTNIGGDYMLTFSDAFAVINGISDKNVVYSQKPAAIYQQYINDDFESYTVEGAADSRNAEGSTFWTKNPGVSSDMIEQDGGSGAAGNSTYAVTDGENKVLKLDGSVVLNKSKANEVGAKYALEGYKTGDNNWNTNNKPAVKGKLQIKFDVKNVAQPNDGVTATTPPVFTLATNPYYTKILGITNDTLYIYSKADGTLFDVMPSEDQVHTLASTPTGFHAVEISPDFDNNIMTVKVDGTQYYTGKMYPKFYDNGLSWLRFIQLKHSKSTEDGALNEWSTEDYGKAYTLIDNVEVINSEPVAGSGIKSVQYSSDGINYSPAIGKVDSDVKNVKVDFTDAMDADTLSNIKLLSGSTAVGSNGAVSNDNKTYTLTLTDKLATSTEYTLNIPTTVKTVGGNSFAREYNGRITTTAGVFKIDLLDIQKGGVSVAKSDIGANDTIDAVVNITNTEGRTGEVYLCICVYNNDVMTQVNFDKINLKTESTKSVPITVASTANIKVKAFLWNDFATMKPLVKNKTVE